MPTIASLEALHKAIQGRFETQVATPESLLVEYDNGPPVDKKTASLWARLSVRPGEARQLTIGTGTSSRSFRIPGIVAVQIFVSVTTGFDVIQDLADKIRIQFQGVSAGGVLYRSPTQINVGRQGGFWQVNMNIPFQTDIIG